MNLSCTPFASLRAVRFPIRWNLPAMLLGLVVAIASASPALAAPSRSAAAARVITRDATDALQRDGRAVLWVYFTDKGERDLAGLRRAITEAGARLPLASRARRSRQTGGTFEADYTDVPCVAGYIQAVEATGARVRHASRWLNAVSVEVDEARALAIASLPFVREVARVMSTDPQLGPPASYGSSATQNTGVNAIAAHDSGYSAAGVVVAIFDTGFRKDHASLAPLKRIAEWDFVGSDGETANQAGDVSTQWDHGTGVWSILGGYMPGTLVGPAFNASFVLAKTKNTTITSSADEDRWVAAAQWADSIGVDIVQSSMVVSYPASSLNGKTTPMALATNVLKRHGILVVTAMGNSGPNATTLWTPSDCDSILAVGSANASNVISSFSSRGPTVDGRGKPDLVAQGENTIWATTSSTTSTGTYPGTSLAAPLVSGVAALVQEAHPEWTSQQIRYAMKSTADKASSPDSTTYGWGRPNAVRAIYNSTLGGPIYPKPFLLLAPASGVTGTTSPVSFRWRRAVDLNPGDAVTYALSLKKVSPNITVYSTTTPDTFATYAGSLDPGVLYEWNVVATDQGAHARPSREAFRFTAAGGGGGGNPPIVTAPATATGSENATLSFAVTASDPDGDVITSLTAAPLPTGATFTPNGSNTSGTFSWTPNYTQAGSTSVTFTASNGLSGTAATSITIANVNRPPTLAAIAAITVTGGTSATRSLVASDPDGDAVTLSKLSGPSFATVAGTTLTVSPAVADTGSYTVVVRASDGSLNADQSVSVTVTSATQPPPPASGLVACYAFDEGTGTTTADLSGANHPGTLTLSPAWVAGRYGSALSFNATDDANDSNDPRLTIGPNLNVPNLPLTFSAWVNPSSYADWRAIFSKRNSSSASGCRLDVGLAKTSGRVYLATGATFRQFVYAPAVNVWTHLAVVCETGGSKLYVNGVLQETTTAITLGSNTTANTVIGGTGEALSGGDNDPFKGLIDDVRLYNRSLTVGEIQTDMNTPAGTSSSQPPLLIITQPANGANITGTTVNVTYTASGNLAGVDHVHFQLDSNPIVMDIPMDGVYQFTSVPAGSHVLNGFLVNASHVKIAGTDATPVNFTTSVGDTIPPSVSITSPAPSSSLSGTVTVAANASDNIGVLGVQFKIGGANIGPEDTSSPYSTSLNTTTYNNGTYVLTAVARDAAGNQKTSTGVTVTISNQSANDPTVVGQWSAPFAWPNVTVHAVQMYNGSVLTWDDHSIDPGVQVFNPATGTFTASPYSALNLFCAGQSFLSDGRVFVNGGHAGAYIGIKGTFLFNPATNAWTRVTDMAYARWYPTTIMLPNGNLLTVSGAISCPDCKFPGGPDAGIAEIPEVYSPVANTWTKLTSAQKNFPIYPHLFVLPNGKVIATSTQEDAIPTSVLDMNTQQWTTVDPAVVDGGSTVMYLPGKFMKSGSAINPDYSPLPSSAATHVLDMTGATNTWRDTAPMAFPRTQHNLTVLPDGNVLVTGGSRNSNVFDQNSAVMEAELWNPTTETYTTMAAFQTPRLYHSIAMLLPDGRVLSSGGGRFGPSQLSGEFYSPPYLFKGARPTITSAPSLLEYGTSFTVTTPDGARITKVSLIRLASVSHAINFEQRYLPLSFSTTGGGLTVQAPANSNLAPPGYYMLFIVDSNGIPSVAATLRFPSPAEDLTPPSTPTNLVATGSMGSASLTWTASTDNVGIAAYDVHRSTSSGFTPGAGNKIGSSINPSYSDPGIPAGTYYYKVIARDAAGNVSAASNQATANVTTDTAAPSTPLGLAANPILPNRVDLTWGASTDNVRVANYHVRRGGVVVGTVTTTSFQDTGVSPSTTYSYTVDASDDAGNTSAESAPVTTTTPAQSTLAGSLVASFGFDEGSGTTTADLSGGNHPGTLVNNPTWVAGKYGGGLSFNATDDGIDSNDPRVTVGTALDVPPIPFTFSVWVNPASFADWRAIFSKRNTASASGMRLDVGLTGGSGRVYLATGSTPRQFVYVPPTNTWTHLAIVVESTGAKLYVNGALRETVAAITLGTNSNANVAIGGTGEAASGDNDPYKGALDELRIYNRSLTPTEIQTDMSSPSGAPDSQPPTVSLTAPAGGSTVSGSTAVSANASDNLSVAGVQFKLDGANLGAEDTSVPYSITWNTAGATNGSHTLTAVARDGGGNVTTSAPVSVTVSNPPTLTITQPTNGSTIAGTVVNVTYTTAGDMTGVDHVHFQLDANSVVMDLTLDGTYQLTGVAPGAHVLNGWLVTAGHTKIAGTDAAPINFTTTAPDTIPPTVSITAPTGGSTLAGTVTLTANVNDNTGVVGVKFRIGATDILPEDTTAPYSASLNTTAFANGPYVLTAVARDAAGNQTTSSGVSVTISNTGASGLIASYSFDEGSGTTTTDLSGGGHPGTLTLSPTWTAGKYGSALSFNATDDHNDSNDPRVTVGPNLNVPNLPFTFSAWVNPAGFADWRAIFSKRDSPSASNMRVDIGLSATTGRVYLATGATFRSFTYSPPLNTWTHLAVIADVANSKLYVNGTLQETIGAVTLGTKTLANVVIGGTGEPLTGGDNDPYKGLLDEIRLYSRVLTQTEIQNDMNTPAVSAATTPPSSSENPLASAPLTSNATPPAAPALLRVYPNPFRRSVKIEAMGGDGVRIYDVTGRLVRNWRFTGSSAVNGIRPFEWNGSDERGRRLPGGFYFVKSGPQVVRVLLLR